MRSNEATAIAALDAYLDRVSADRPTTALGALVPSDLAEVDRALRALDDAPPPANPFVDRLEASLLRGAARSAASAAVIPRVTGGSPHSVHIPILVPAPEDRQPRWLWACGHLATAALLILTVVGSYLAFGAFRLTSEQHQAPLIPARDSERALLVEVSVARDAIPDTFDLKLMRLRIDPEREAIVTADSRGDSPGTSIASVLAGQLTLRVEAPFQVLRENEAPEEVQAGTEVVLGIGDAAVFSLAAGRTYGNPGSESVEFLQGNIIPSGWPPQRPASLLGLTDGGPGWLSTSTLPSTEPGPLVLRLERLVVASPELFPPSSAQGPNGIQASVREPAVPGTVRRDGDAQTAYVLTLSPSVGSGDALTS